MSAQSTRLEEDVALQRLLNVVENGTSDDILASLPEPPHFLPALFRANSTARDTIIAGLFPVLIGDEDRWELIEASAMDTVAHPERGAFLAIAPLIPASLLGDTRMLVASIRDPETRRVMERAIEERRMGE
jgi:hypothetical protein